jgi:hypothetical protein
MPPRAQKPIVIAPEYLAELRRRIEEGPGMTAVAKAARMSRTTLWGLLNDAASSRRRATPDAAERVRNALAKLDPTVEAPPPPTVSVRGRVHHGWIALGERLIAADPEAVEAAIAKPDELSAAVLRIGARSRRQPR